MPIVEVKGPYSYKENRTKFVKETSDDKTKVTYTQQRVFYFDPANSAAGLSEKDVICTINLPLIGAISQVENLLPNKTTIFKEFVIDFFQSLFSSISDYTQLCTCHFATELAWNYTDPLVQLLYSESLLKFLHKTLPHPYIQIQLNNSINDTQDSIIHTGVDGIENIGQYIQWDGLTQLAIWPQEHANDINGTEGLIFHPYVSENEVLQVFIQDVIRSFDITYVGEVQHLGLTTFRFELPNTTFESAFTRSDNAKWGSWNPDGLIYLGATQDPVVPIFGSKPHFLDGDPSLRQDIIGLDPDPALNRSQYDTQVDVEPTTGVNIQVQNILQLNIQLNRTSDFPQMKNLIKETTYFPIMYINEHSEFTEELKGYLEDHGLREIHTLYIVQWSVVAVFYLVAAALFVASLLICKRFVQLRRPQNSERTPLVTLTRTIQ